MKLIRKSPQNFLAARDFGNAFAELSRRFFDDDFFSTELAGSSWSPKVDVFEEKDRIIVKADVPGMDEKDLNVELEDGMLRISGSKKEELETNDTNYHRIERSYGSFSRSIPLPNSVKTENIQAEYKKGVLTVSVPKAKEAETRKVSVRVN